MGEDIYERRLMIEVAITDEMLLEARRKANEMGKLKNSMMQGERNLHGFLGELAAQKVIGGEFHNTYDYDILLNGKRIDVKTKAGNYTPKPHYNCTIFAYSRKQQCDFFVFTYIKKDLTSVWVLGAYDRLKFLDDADYVKAGDKCENNGLVFKKDNYSMTVDQLSPVEVVM